MKKNRNNIDDLFRDELGSYTETPPGAVWNALEKRLDNLPKNKPASLLPKVWYYIIGAIALIIGTSVYLYTTQPSQSMTATGALSNGAANANSNSDRSAGHSSTAGNSATTSSDVTPAGNGAIADNSANNAASTTNDAGNMTGNQTRNNNGTNDKNVTDKKTAASSRNNTGRKKGSPLSAFLSTVHSTSITNPLTQNTDPSVIPNANNETASPSKPTIGAAMTDEPLPAADPSQVQKNNFTPGKDSATTPEAKKPEIKQPKTHHADSIVKKDPKTPQKRFEYGVKGGYEFGFNSDAAHKYVGSAFIQYNLLPRFSLMLQPTIKSDETEYKAIGSNQSYYSVVPGSTDSATVSTWVTNTAGDSIGKKYHFLYTQSHYTIVKSYSLVRNYAEFELPLLLKYKLTQKLSGYIGGKMSYSKNMSVTENTNTSAPINIAKDSTTGLIGSDETTPKAPALSKEITYNINPLSSYKGALYPPTTGYSLSFGYMVGVSYAFNHKWLFDALLQQGNTPQNNQGGYNINSALSAPYVRFTLGYTLSK